MMVRDPLEKGNTKVASEEGVSWRGLPEGEWEGMAL